jgi:hypothetical protein
MKPTAPLAAAAAVSTLARELMSSAAEPERGAEAEDRPGRQAPDQGKLWSGERLASPVCRRAPTAAVRAQLAKAKQAVKAKAKAKAVAKKVAAKAKKAAAKAKAVAAKAKPGKAKAKVNNALAKARDAIKSGKPGAARKAIAAAVSCDA